MAAHQHTACCRRFRACRLTAESRDSSDKQLFAFVFDIMGLSGHLATTSPPTPSKKGTVESSQVELSRCKWKRGFTENKRLEPSADLLHLSNAELGAVTSILLVSLLQHCREWAFS